MFHAQEKIQAPFGVRPARGFVPVQRRAPTGVPVPRMPRRKRVDEFEIESSQRDAVTHADLDIRPEAQPIGDRRRLEVPAEIKQIRVYGSPRRTPARACALAGVAIAAMLSGTTTRATRSVRN